MKSLIFISISSLVVLFPGHVQGRGDSGGLQTKSYSPQATLTKPSLSSQETLQPVYLNKLRPYGTYTNNYAPGNCTSFVASRLPVPDNLGNANQWAYNAAADGLNVGAVPKEGSIAQTTGDSYLGHVAVVESVNPDGTFVISEMNAQGWGVVDTRTATVAEFSSFIYP